MNREEAERIRRVYAEYDEDPAVQRRWDAAQPGNVANRAALKRQLAALLPGIATLRVLEIGCGTGDILALAEEIGAAQEQLAAVDLRMDALAYARTRLPRAQLIAGNGEELPFADGGFDLVLLFTVFSSVLGAEVQRNIAAEAVRVLRPGGAVLWFDMRLPNPWNRNVHAVRKSDLRRMFPGLVFELKPAVLIPQVARSLGPLTGLLFPLLHALPFLRSHWLGMLRKPASAR